MISMFIARRYIFSSATERLLTVASLVAFGSVALGSMALILALAILGGFERELSANAVTFTAHIEVTGFGKRSLSEAQAVMRRMKERVPNVHSVSAFVQAEGVARSSAAMDGVIMKGIIPSEDVGGIANSMREGTFAFSAPDAREVIIGATMARKLHVGIGKKLIVYSTDNVTAERAQELTGSEGISLTEAVIRNAVIEQFTIVGIYETGMSEYDDLYVYLPFARAASAFRLPEGAASGFDILVHDVGQVKETAAAIDSLFGYPFFSMTLYEKYNDIFAWIDLQKQPVPLILGLITIVAVFNIVATLLMAVVQKMSSIGVLRAMGMPERTIVRIFILQGLALGGAGSILGCIIAFFACVLQAKYKIISLQGSIYFLNAVPIEFAWQHYALVLGVSFAMSAIAAWVPARIGGRIPVLTALRFQ